MQCAFRAIRYRMFRFGTKFVGNLVKKDLAMTQFICTKDLRAGVHTSCMAGT